MVQICPVVWSIKFFVKFLQLDWAVHSFFGGTKLVTKTTNPFTDLDRGAFCARAVIDEVDDDDGRGEVDLEALDDCLPPSDITKQFFFCHFLCCASWRNSCTLF